MNDLNLDFGDKSESSKLKRRFYTYFGLFLCIFVPLQFYFGKEGLIQIISSICNFLVGIFCILQVNPKIINWQKCYVSITETDIEYKFWEIQRKTKIKWDSVKSLRLDKNRISFDLNNNKTIKLNLSFVSISTSRKIIQSILGFGTEKGLKISRKENQRYEMK